MKSPAANPSQTAWDYIDSKPSLAGLCKALQGQKWLALDTEFMRERTYYAKLCLLQIASETTIACIDPLALDSLDPLLDLLYESDTIKILHSARQDLELFYNLRGSVPAPVFDTQIAAALAGFPHQISYANLVKEITGKQLDKGHTRANWAARPLAEAQLEYAVDDVRFLPDLYRYLHDRLADLGRLEWLQEECSALADTALYANDPETAYLRIKHAGNMMPDALDRLKRLAAWRERQAKQHNLPRHWIIRDDGLMELACNNPQDIQDLRSLKSLSQKNTSRWGKAILELLKAKDAVITASVSQKQPLSRKQAELVNEFVQYIRRFAAENEINSNILASRNDVKEFVINPDSSPIMHGWRRKIIGEHLLDRMAQSGDT